MNNFNILLSFCILTFTGCTKIKKPDSLDISIMNLKCAIELQDNINALVKQKCKDVLNNIEELKHCVDKVIDQEAATCLAKEIKEYEQN
jgi:hypothetical protein